MEKNDLPMDSCAFGNTPSFGASTIGAGAGGASQLGLEGPNHQNIHGILWVFYTPKIQLLNIHGILVTHGFILGHMFFVMKNVGMDSFEAMDIRHLHHSDSVSVRRPWGNQAILQLLDHLAWPKLGMKRTNSSPDN